MGDVLAILFALLAAAYAGRWMLRSLSGGGGCASGCGECSPEDSPRGRPRTVIVVPLVPLQVEGRAATEDGTALPQGQRPGRDSTSQR